MLGFSNTQHKKDSWACSTDFSALGIPRKSSDFVRDSKHTELMPVNVIPFYGVLLTMVTTLLASIVRFSLLPHLYDGHMY